MVYVKPELTVVGSTSGTILGLIPSGSDKPGYPDFVHNETTLSEW